MFGLVIEPGIPKPYESMTRYYGWYSCRARGEREKHTPLDTSGNLPEPKAAPSRTWAACMKRIFGINPLECPHCKGNMRIIAFLTDEKDILNIADALRIPRAQAPPKIPKAPTQEFFDNLPPDDFA